jgi:hypothetical protein
LKRLKQFLSNPFVNFYSTSIRVLVSVFFCFQSCLWAAEPEARDLIQTKEKAVPFGKHPLLEADNVQLEFRVDPGQVGQAQDWRQSGNSSTLQQMGVGSGLQLGPASTLTHDFLIGAGQEAFTADPVFGQSLSQRFQQRQLTTFSTKPTSESRLFLTNEIISEQRNERSTGTQAWKQGAGFEYALPLGIGIRPEVAQESFRNELQQETQRTNTTLAISKDLVPERLNLQIKPGMVTEQQHYSGGQQSEATQMDLSLAWKPDINTEWVWGAKAQQTDRLQAMSQEEWRSLYTQVSYQLWSDLAVRVRGDVQKTETFLNDHDLTGNESRMNLSFGPSMKLNDSISAGADLGYQQRYDHLNKGQSSEQSLSLSIKGTF